MMAGKFGFVAVLGHLLFGCGAVQAQTAIGSFNVTVVLRTFSQTVTADQRCTHSGRISGGNSTLRIHCPAAVDVQAIARASASQTAQKQRMNAELGLGKESPLIVSANQLFNSVDPVELTISW
jgi:hypothetical protein